MTVQPPVHPKYGIGILPPFMRPVTPKPVYTVAETKSPTPRYYLLEDPQAGIFNSLGAIDAHIHKNLGGTVRYEADLIPRAGDATNPLQHGSFLVEKASLSNPKSTGGGVYFFSSDDLATQVEGWTYHYLMFLDTADRYLQDPADFYTAYRFIETHPAFYHRNHPERDDWEQESGLGSMWQTISPSPDIAHGVVVCLEHGPYDDDTKTQPSHDHYLDAYGDSYEDAIVDFARNVHNYYTLLGVERDKPLRKLF